MAIDSQTISELESRIGVEETPLVYDIERGMIKRFARALGDPNPLWQDEDYAEKSGYGGIVAPPNFILTLGFDRVLEAFISDASLTVLHGSTELECHQPARPGDVITVTAKIVNVRERQGKVGTTVFVTFEMVYKNQRQEVVADCRQMAIIY
ncbi:MAG: MaoC family dehydratase N-terminal domain-containing protein [Dehalococcoidales bacterium]|nr:MaoC family dehydratase N-terminal domain-containing protein [Dehalococcoidales bacterium]